MLYSRLDNGGAGPMPPYMNPGGPSASPTPTATVPTAPPPPAPSPNVTVAGSGYTPDYKGLLANDPGYVAAQNAAEAAAGTAKAQRAARLRALYVQYGGNLPDSFKDQYGDIDQATKDAATANQNSTLARLRDNYQQGVAQFQRGLAARGMLQSGELGYGQDQLNRGYQQQQYDAANQFTNTADDAINQYLGVLSGNAQNLAGAIGSAESNVYSNPAYRPVAPTSANYDAGSSAQYGQPVYKGSDGSLYDQYGNPFSPPQASASAAPTDPYNPFAGTNIHTPGFQLD